MLHLSKAFEVFNAILLEMYLLSIALFLSVRNDNQDISSGPSRSECVLLVAQEVASIEVIIASKKFANDTVEVKWSILKREFSV